MGPLERTERQVSERDVLRECSRFFMNLPEPCVPLVPRIKRLKIKHDKSKHLKQLFVGLFFIPGSM